MRHRIQISLLLIFPILRRDIQITALFTDFLQALSDAAWISQRITPRKRSRQFRHFCHSAGSATTVPPDAQPNIVCVLLESFADPSDVNFLNMSEDPIPNFHNLEANYSSGYLTVPVVGAGTANTEFEVLTGMSMQYFGTGEYPYKTILKQSDCESIASALSKIGYGTHVVHNNTEPSTAAIMPFP